MPLYEYECEECGHRTEVIQRLNDPPLAACPSCGGAVKRLLSAPAFQFKGTGWYVTDYAKKGSGEPASEAREGSKTESKKADSGGEKGDKAKSASGGKKEAAGAKATD